MKTAFPSGEWYDYIPEIMAGLRMLPSRIGVSPFVIAYKQEPRWHTIRGELVATNESSPPTDEDA